MAWDRAEFRRRAVEAVQRWADAWARLAASALPDRRGDFWLESLIRYRLRSTLPDIEREGIPGGRGRSEWGLQDGADSLIKHGMFEGRDPYQPILPYFSDVVFRGEADAGWQQSIHLHDSLRYWPDGFYSIDGSATCEFGDYNDSCRLWLPCNLSTQDEWSPPVYQYSGMFTGEMSRLVQLLFGMGEKIPYRSCYERTHGIYTSGNGSKWVIEICEDGVTAWPLDLVRLDLPGSDLGYVPVPTGETLPLMSERRMLASAAEMEKCFDDARGTQPHFRECGWAFDSRGARAVNVASRVSDDPMVGSREGVSFRVTIADGGDHPSSASVSEVEKGWLFNDSQTLNGMKTMNRSTSQGYCLRSYPFSVVAGLAPSDNVRAPVYAYYDGDQEITVYHRHNPSTTEDIDETPPNANFGCFNGILYPVDNQGTPYRKGRDVIRSATWFEISGYERGFEEPTQRWQTRATEVSGTWEQLGGYVTHTHDASRGIASEHHRLTEKHVLYDYDYPTFIEQLLIPAHSRTSFYLMQTRGPWQESKKTTFESISAYAKGNFRAYYTCAEVLINEWVHRDPRINPCDCGEDYDVVGMVAERDAPTESIDDYEVAGGTADGVPLLAPVPEPNGLWDHLCLFDVYCFEHGRPGTRPYTGACKWVDPGSIGACNSEERQTKTEETIEAANPDGFFKLAHYGRGIRTLLIDDVFDLNLRGPWWAYQEEGSCQWLDEHRDAWTGYGTVSKDIVQPFFLRHTFGNPESFYPQIADLIARERGWFGIPFQL